MDCTIQTITSMEGGDKTADLTLQRQLFYWTSLTLAINAMIWYILCGTWTFDWWKGTFEWNCPTKHSMQSPQGYHDWNPSLMNNIIFFASLLPLRLKAESCFWKQSPLRCPLSLPLVFFSSSVHERVRQRERELKGWIKCKRKVGCSLCLCSRGFKVDVRRY